MTVVSDEAKEYRDTVAKLAKAQGMRLPLDGRVKLTLRLYPARPKDWAKRAQRDPDRWDDDVRCIDLGNAEKVLEDALNGIAWIDDKQVRECHKFRCEPDEHGARVEVDIEPIRKTPIAPSLFEGEETRCAGIGA